MASGIILFKISDVTIQI